MAGYEPSPGPSRSPARITLPPMVMLLPPHHRTIDYHDEPHPHTNFHRLPYVGPTPYDYGYEFTNSMAYRTSDDDHQLSQNPNISNDHSHFNPGPHQALSLSMLLAAANAAQANPTTAHLPSSPSNFPPTLPIGCPLSTHPNYDVCDSSPATSCWPSVGLSAGDSDRLGPSPPETPLDNHSAIYGHSTPCSRLENDWAHHRESKWAALSGNNRVRSDAVYDPKPCLELAPTEDYSHHSIITQSSHHPQPHHHHGMPHVQVDVGEVQLDPHFNLQHAISIPEPLNSSLNSNPVDDRNFNQRRFANKKPKLSPESSEIETGNQKSDEKPSSNRKTQRYSSKPKQGRKKRSAGYVRPIIIHRKRVGQRLLDMLKTAPVPSKPPSMEVSKARCFPFADMNYKLREWYGLQIEWPEDGAFGVDELKSTRRMRLDELERLDKTLDGGCVKLRLSDQVLDEEPHRRLESSFPSDGAVGDDNSSQLDLTDQSNSFEEDYGHRRNKKRSARL